MVPDLNVCLMTCRHLPEAQIPPQLGSARADTWQLLEQAPGRAAHHTLIGLALPRLLPRAVHLLVCPAEEGAMSADARGSVLQRCIMYSRSSAFKRSMSRPHTAHAASIF